MIVCLISIFLTYSYTYAIVGEYSGIVKTEAYYYGSRADIIYKVQYNLKKWGYFKGEIDGIYGYQTYTAVKSFQSKNGLKADGIIGDRTLAALGLATKAVSSSSSNNTNNQNVDLLARLINGEARGEPYEGQVAVGAVVLNRVRNPEFPSTVAGVIYQPGAFTAIVDGQINAKIEPNSIKAARDALNGWDPSGGAIYYYNPAKTTNKWIWSRPLIKIIGKHRFCR
ncbi:spore cortex-lytic enzyme [Haloimpatiens sp. FM7315]|uniref:spore cortex-lytic enzyme n=1 Tax=Haloimpatiens sp. FM7315 TaxID=3298609 RepID=UPI0035A30885